MLLPRGVNLKVAGARWADIVHIMLAQHTARLDAPSVVPGLRGQHAVPARPGRARVAPC